MVENGNGETRFASPSHSVNRSDSRQMVFDSVHQFADTHYFKSLSSRCLESPNCYIVKLANVRAIYLYLCVCVIANFNFSGLDFGKPQNDLPTLVHIAPSNETNVFDAVASSLLQGSMLMLKGDCICV